MKSNKENIEEEYQITLTQYKGKNTDYFGFTLQDDFWYGEAKENDKIYKVATSGWESNGDVSIYFKNDKTNEWDLHWVAPEYISVDKYYSAKEDRLSFDDWLENEMGISYYDFYMYYPESMTKNMTEEYNLYLYNGIPSFARDTNEKIEKNNKEINNYDDFEL